MRDPNRIPFVLARLQAVWQMNPDLRLSQLLWNVYASTDPYYIEDDEFLKEIEAYYEAR